MFSVMSESSSNIAGFGGSVVGFRFRCFGRDEVAKEAARSVSHDCLGTENESHALQHDIGVV